MTGITKAAIRVLILCAAIGLLCAGSASAENLLSIQVGAYSPGSDYPETADDGGDFGIFYTNASRRVGLEIGMHGYGTKFKSGAEVSALGLEALVTFQKPMAGVQPYAGLGFGYYSIATKPVTGGEQAHDGFGLVAEAGIRVFMDEMFLGLQVKGFTNNGQDRGLLAKDPDYGGKSASLMLGMVF